MHTRAPPVAHSIGLSNLSLKYCDIIFADHIHYFRDINSNFGGDYNSLYWYMVGKPIDSKRIAFAHVYIELRACANRRVPTGLPWALRHGLHQRQRNP